MIEAGALFCGDRSSTRHELDTHSLKAAAGLAALGVAPGDTIALLLRNDLAFLEASVAATALGAYAVPINWHLSAPEVCYVLEDCDARVLIAHSDLLNALPGVRTLADERSVPVIEVETPPAVRQAFALDNALCAPRDGAHHWESWLARHDPLASPYTGTIESMIYTSGTTGKPKGVRRLPQPSEQAAAFATVRDRIYGIHSRARSLLPGPLYHSAPNSFALRSARQSERLVIMPRFSATTFLSLIEQHGITNTFIVPTMLVRLLKLPQEVRDGFDVRSLEHVMVAAAPCAPQAKRAAIDWWGPIVHEFYGATEMGYMTICDSAQTLAKPGTVGKRVEGVTLKALDEQGKEVPIGEPGELFGRMSGFPDFTYHKRPDERAACERDGLISCGDVGYFDDDGYLFLCDRRREMVISGGVNIYPAEIESVLVNMPGVIDCAVIGIPDDEFGEQLLAVIAPQDGVHLNDVDVIEWLQSRIAGYKVPRQIEFRSALPRDDAGKIYKRRLREPYWAGRERQI